MENSISKQSRRELTDAIRKRYARASKQGKSRILDEFVSLTGYHRKHAIRLLTSTENEAVARASHHGRRIYDEAVKEALIIIWEASDRICGKRLKVVLPILVDSMERNGHLDLDPEVRVRLLEMSASTIDRMLTSIREQAKGKRKKKNAPKKASKQIPVRTFSEWKEPIPGELEIDFVVHCGETNSGVCIHSLVATDVCSGWTEAVPLLAREQSLAVEGLDVICHRFPVPVIGLNSDNDGAFINDTLLDYCLEKKLKFTRSRPYQKNDQAWIEQKNGAVIRRFVGYDRFSGLIAGQLLGHLYQSTRLYVNFFQPSFKLLEKTRIGSTVKKRYSTPMTPADRLLENTLVSEEHKKALRMRLGKLDPIVLLHRIRDAQAALASLGSPGAERPGKDLDDFLAQLSKLWEAGEARPTHRRKYKEDRRGRTRPDPFEDTWPEVLYWLSEDPDSTAKSLFQRLMVKYPGKYCDGQLRTLQRRVKEWRSIMARELVFACNEEDDDKVATFR